MQDYEIAVIIGRSGRRFTLIEPHDLPEVGITVPAGYRCDFASVPKILWFWLPPLGYYSRAALLHDYLYDCHHTYERCEDAPARCLVTRAEADKMFLQQMKRDGVGWRTRWTMYLAVRLCGGKFWNAK